MAKEANYMQAMNFLQESSPDPDGKPDEKVCEAYRIAHQIRQFEIELYWKRSTYLWTMQAASLAGLALVLASSDIGPWFSPHESDPLGTSDIGNKLRIITLAAIWFFGVSSGYVWLLLIRGSKFWQNNWERHVDELEDMVSGPLYKIYLADDLKPPYSVSKLNELMAGIVLLMWVIIGVSVGILLFASIKSVATLLAFIFGLLFLSYFFDDCLRMGGFGEKVDLETEPVSAKHLISRRKKHKK